jgi:uncharacterized protein (TIGR02466 family)
MQDCKSRELMSRRQTMTFKHLFATPFYESTLSNARLVKALERSCKDLSKADKAGIAWSQANGYPGYTSYASLNDLPKRDPDFDDLKRILDKHAATFAKETHMDLGGRRPKLDSIWVNILKPRGGHSGHIHPHSIISGTVYIAVPEGSGALKLEDPRLPMMMAAPTRTGPTDSGGAQPFHYAAPEKGTIFMWESWLRHEVVPNGATSDRISISFNYS